MQDIVEGLNTDKLAITTALSCLVFVTAVSVYMRVKTSCAEHDTRKAPPVPLH